MRSSLQDPSPRQRKRGQTSIDLLISAALFLLAVSLIFVNSTGILFPVLTPPDQTTEDQGIADRVETEYLGDPHTETLSAEKIKDAITNNDTVADIKNELHTDKDVYITITPAEDRSSSEYSRVFKQEYHGNTELQNNTLSLPTYESATDNLNQVQRTVTRYSMLQGTPVKIEVTIGETPET